MINRTWNRVVRAKPEERDADVIIPEAEHDALIKFLHKCDVPDRVGKLVYGKRSDIAARIKNTLLAECIAE